MYSNTVEELKILRKTLGLSQHDLGRMLGYSNGQFISNVERGLAGFPIKKLSLISDADLRKSMADAVTKDAIGIILDQIDEALCV